MPILVILLLAAIFILVKSADLTLKSIHSLTRKFHVKAFVVSALVLAVATSLPELFIGLAAAFNGSPNLSLGNIFGANVANLSLVAGIAAFVAGGVLVKEKIIIKEVILAGLAAIFPVILLLDGTLSRVDGAILLITYIIYTTSFFKLKFLEIGRHHINRKVVMRFIKNAEAMGIKSEKTFGHFLLGVVGLLFSSNLIVKFSSELAEISGIPIFVVGIVLLSIGTTLPELILSVESLKKGQSSIFFGNILGSLVVDSTLILGLVALVSPIHDGNIQKYLITLICFGVTFFFFWFFTKTKSKLDRSEAAFLLLIYVIFVFLVFKS
ncbi:MAG: sodium:calcium antiporter [Microgenomates group bacterium]